MLSKLELEEIEKICEKWMFKKEFTFDKLYESFKDVDFSSLINAFTKRLEKVPCKFSKSEQVSGSICFFGGVFTSLLNYGYIEEIEGLFTFALCYMLIDHFLDDCTISSEEKKKCMEDIYLFISDNKINNENKLINAAAERYLSLIQRVPQSKEYLMKLFKSELQGYNIQRNCNHDRETYLKIAEEKGGLTSACIAVIIGLNPEGDNYILGGLIQTPCDDLLDVKDDTSLGIYTLIRYDIDHNILDRHIYESIKKIYNLSSIYNFFKVILLLGIVLGIHDNPGCVSEEFTALIEKYDPFPKDTSKDSLTEWFHEKLYSYIEEFRNLGI